MTKVALFSMVLALATGVLLAACDATARSPGATPIPQLPGWKLVWHDEFDGSAIDSANWTYDIGAGGWGNGEAQYYTSRPENARVENGMLVIEARQEKYEDSYRKQIGELIEAKLEGREAEEGEAAPRLAPVVDLMQALQKSLASKKPPKGADTAEPTTKVSKKRKTG